MMDNDQIAGNVNHIVDVFFKELKKKPNTEDEKFIRSAIDLVINLLQNINDIAHSLREIEERGRPNQ
jgi:hypothetical protein